MRYQEKDSMYLVHKTEVAIAVWWDGGRKGSEREGVSEKKCKSMVLSSNNYVTRPVVPAAHWSDILFRDRTVPAHCVAKRRRLLYCH